ncbi:MAG: glycosyltransferase family 4 protein [Salegentibacter sp.]
MKHLVYIGNKLESRGGAPTSIDILPHLLRKEGVEVSTASSRKNKILRLFEMQLLLFSKARRADLVLIDTYSTQNFWYAVISSRVCRLLKLPYILFLHGGNLGERLQRNPRVSKNLFGNSRCNIVPSEFLLEKFRRKGIRNLRHIPNSIALADYLYQERSYLRPKLLWVRSFSEVYNPLLAIKVLEKLKEKYKEAELCMVGPAKDGSLQVCKQYVQKKGLPVSFPGKLSKEEWLHLSRHYDLFLNTTNIDNTPVSVLEAMALGLPVVSTEVGGMPYLLRNRKEGLLVPPNDETAMLNAIETLLANPAIAQDMSAKAREKVENFDWYKVKQQWLELLR